MQPWRIQFFGRFELWAPTGEPAQSATLKAKALVALLAINRKYGMGREELACALWPDSDAQRSRASVKQALSMVRRMIGDENLQTSALSCRLSDTLAIESDLDDSAAQRKPFMPGFEGEWFDCIRQKYDGYVEHSPHEVRYPTV